MARRFVTIVVVTVVAVVVVVAAAVVVVVVVVVVTVRTDVSFVQKRGEIVRIVENHLNHHVQ